MKIKRKQKKLIAAGVCLGVVLLGGFLGLKRASSCPVQEEIKTVRGNSLEPLVPSGSEITALVGYYDCHEWLPMIPAGTGYLLMEKLPQIQKDFLTNFQANNRERSFYTKKIIKE